MSVQLPSALQQTGNAGGVLKRGALQEGNQWGCSSKVYLHSVTDTQAAVLTESKFQEIKQKTGADVHFDPNVSDVQNTKIVIIRGSRSQIEATVSAITQVIGTQETISAQAQTFWQQWVEAAYPDLESRAYFLPPVYFNPGTMTRQSTAGQEVLVLHEAPGQAGQSTPGQAGQRTPRQAARAPRQSSRSLRQLGLSPRQLGLSPRQLGLSPRQLGLSPRQLGLSPRQLGLSPKQLGLSPKQLGISPKQLGISPKQLGLSPKQLCLSPRQIDGSNPLAMNPFTLPPYVQNSDFRDDTAMQSVLLCLQKMSEDNREVLIGLSQLQFGQYLGEPCYAAAAAHLPVADSLPTSLQKNKQRDFDALLIHRQYGIVVCKVKVFSDSMNELNMSHQDTDKNIRSKLTDAVAQLDKAKVMLSHLVSDVNPGVRITKTIVIPNLTRRQVQQAISSDPKLMQDLCRCLGTTDPADITGLCVCSDQLSDPKTPWDVSSDVLRELGNWWQRRVAVSGPDSHMTCDSYKTLVARFCGPAATVTVPCTCPPRLCVKTMVQAVSLTGECYTAQITLFPEQVHLLSTAYSRLSIWAAWRR